MLMFHMMNILKSAQKSVYTKRTQLITHESWLAFILDLGK